MLEPNSWFSWWSLTEDSNKTWWLFCAISICVAQWNLSARWRDERVRIWGHYFRSKRLFKRSRCFGGSFCCWTYPRSGNCGLSASYAIFIQCWQLQTPALAEGGLQGSCKKWYLNWKGELPCFSSRSNPKQNINQYNWIFTIANSRWPRPVWPAKHHSESLPQLGSI